VQYDRISLGPPTGGTIYLADLWPAARGSFLAGDFLGHSASWWKLEAAGATFRVKYQGKFLDSHDSWFGATDLCVAPDGSLFLSDFCDKRTAHPDPDADWDRTIGRIYHITSQAGRKSLPPINLTRLSSDELVNLLSHRNHWHRERARVQLASRNDRTVVPRLQAMARQTTNHDQAREALWALAGIGSDAWDDTLADELLKHPSDDVRVWMVRLLGDRRQVTGRQAARLVDMAADDPSVAVRCQLAASSRRLPASPGLAIAENLLIRKTDVTDPCLPLLLWWSLEDKAISEYEKLIQFVAAPDHRGNSLIVENRLRLMRRFAADGTATGDAAVLRLLTVTDPTEPLLQALSRGLSERSAGLPEVGQGGLFSGQAIVASPAISPVRKYQPPSEALRDDLAQRWSKRRIDLLRLRLALQVNHRPAHDFLSHLLSTLKQERARLTLLELVAEFGTKDMVPVVLSILREPHEDAVHEAALRVLGKFLTAEIAQEILKLYATMPASLQSRSRDLLFSRVDAARDFLTLLEHQPKRSAGVPLEQVRLLALLNDDELNARVRKLWGNVQPGTSEEKLAEMRRFNNDLRAGMGDPLRGRMIYQKHCGVCHKLNNEGNQIGPELSIAARGERDALLAHIVDPNSVIRSQYLAYVVRTVAGTVHSGLIAEQDAASITLLDGRNQRTRILRSQIDEMTESTISLMPEKLLNALSPQELRDLFGYLQKK
jgi:putative heme-binding domain-containing protein